MMNSNTKTHDKFPPGVVTRPMYQDMKLDKCSEVNIKLPPAPPKKEVKPSTTPPKKTDEIKVKPPPVPPKKTEDIKVPEKKPEIVEVTHSCGGTILIEPSIIRRNCIWITPTPASLFKDNLESIPKISKVENVKSS